MRFQWVFFLLVGVTAFHVPLERRITQRQVLEANCAALESFIKRYSTTMNGPVLGTMLAVYLHKLDAMCHYYRCLMAGLSKRVCLSAYPSLEEQWRVARRHRQQELKELFSFTTG